MSFISKQKFMLFLYLILIFLASAVLVKAADLVIRNLSKIADVLGWSEFIISFFLVAIATSLPEIFVAVTSSLHKSPTLSLGNVIGANIINLTLILGLAAILGRGLKFDHKFSQKNIFYVGLIAVYPAILALDGSISRIDGLALLLLFSIYSIFSAIQEKKFNIVKIYDGSSKKKLIKNITYFSLGVILLIGSAEIIVRLAQILALGLHLPLILIGVFLVSIGTTLPELTFSLRAVTMGHKEMSLGNSLGTVVTNSTLALGLAAIIYPIRIINFSVFLLIALFLLLAIVLFFTLFRSRAELSWQEGIILILFYFIFLIVQFLGRGG